MMVIKGTIAANTLANNLVGDVLHLPADRCAWTTSAVTAGGYKIDKAFFMSATGNVAVTAPALGFIGKSGRFVEIAV
tara:strand:+ start:258 stop:488 length:231 start_codon:yes stop_codon:yes gene_type:complete